MKRISSFMLALALAFACCCGVVFAEEEEESDARASLTLSSYSADLSTGSKPGEFCVDYIVMSNKEADSIGVSSISIYRADGSYVTTIAGSTDNGMVRKSSAINVGTYTYTGASGASYYAKVTVYATVGSVTDSRIVTTDVLKTS